MGELTKKRVHWTEYNGEELLHDEDVDVLTSADAVTFDDGEDLQHKYTQGQFVSPSVTGSLTNLSTTNKSTLVDAINEVKTNATSNESSINSLTNRVTPINKGGTGATTASGALTNLGITATASELNKLDGVTATTTELNYVDGVTSNIQTQLNNKQATVTGGASTITSSNLTTSRALISNGSGKVAVSDVTSTELGYLDGVTSNIQTQLDGKSASDHTHTFASLTSKPTTISGYGITDSIGTDLEGQSVKIAYSGISSTTVTAGTNAEIFNDYRTRTFAQTNYGYFGNEGNIASGAYSHAEGEGTTASGDQSHAEGDMTTASGRASHVEGCMNTASGAFSHSEGHGTTASGSYAHAEGMETSASGSASHAEGEGTTASGKYSHAEGLDTTASGHYSHAEGSSTTASAFGSHAEGGYTTAEGGYSHAGGYHTIANYYQLVHGRYNTESAGPAGTNDMTGDIFIIGNGTSDTARANALRTTTAGKTYGLDSFSGSGAGVAEFFEWHDGNPNAEDRRGLFVTLVGEKIKIASPDDRYILGMIDPCPYVVGDVQSEIWKDMYLKDVFGQKLTETVEVEETRDEEGNIIPSRTEKKWVLNPEYDPSQTYVSRDDRKEFDAITSKGKVVMIDDGTCQVDSYCTVGQGGKATASDTNYKVRVLKRIDDSHILVYIDSVFINR